MYEKYKTKKCRERRTNERGVTGEYMASSQHVICGECCVLQDLQLGSQTAYLQLCHWVRL